MNPNNGYEYTWAFLYYYYALGDVTTWAQGPYTYYYSSWMRDANGSTNPNGKVAWFGLNWDHVQGTTPAGPGTNGLMKNLLNLIDPSLLTSSGGGDEPILPYDGPVDIADAFAWVYSSNSGTISGGDGSDLAHRAVVSVIGTPKTIYFEAMARAKKDVSLNYEWQFEPTASFSTWTKYTSHAYTGGIDPDGTGPLVMGDPFPVNVRCYNSTYGSYASAPTTERDSDSVLVSVAGALAVDIMDNGSTFPGKTFTPDGSGNISFQVLYKIINGAAPYDSVWIDYDYNFSSFTNRVQITPTPGEGTGAFTLTIPSVVAGHSYYIAIRVNDADAPNLMDTYVWSQPVKGGSPVAVVNDNGTANVTAIETDLTTLGSGYTELTSSQISSGSDLAAYKVVIWCPGTSYGEISSTEEAIMINYVQVQHGNLFVPYYYLYGTSNSTFYQMLGSQYNFWTWFGSWWPCGGNDYYGHAYVVGSGPGGTITQLNTNYVSTATEGYGSYMINGSSGETVAMIGEPNYAPSYIEGMCRDNYTAGAGGKACWLGFNWNEILSTTPSTPGRAGALWNIIEILDSSVI
jgi:hypothetical protein